MLPVTSLHGSSSFFSAVVTPLKPPSETQVLYLFSSLFYYVLFHFIINIAFSDDPKKIDHLLKLDGAKERLQLFKANLLEEGSFDSVVQGCYGVFHTASPFYHDVKDPQAELIDPAVKGTLNVLKSCAKSPSLKRVVLTSSMAAVAYNRNPRTPDVVVDETWFTDPDLSRESNVCVSIYLV